MRLSTIFYSLSFLFVSSICFSQVVNNESELNSAINSAQPGTTIILADGIWNDVFIDIDKNGTPADPIVITAQNPGAALMTGNSRVYMEGSYITVSGLVFQDPSNLETSGSSTIKSIFELKRCDYCKVLDNKIDAYNGTESQKTMTFKWILTDGVYNEIAYNSFIGKYGVGSIINDNRNTASPDYLRIHHNYFADRTPINEVNDDNDQDAIRIGNSGSSLDDSFSEVHDNYFYNFFGEVEVISNKSGQNKYYNNTFRDYSGTLTLRHGNNCEVYGNYFFAENNEFSGGIRVIGEGHKVYNNYIEGVNSTKPNGSTSNATGGINVSNGRLNSALNGYYQVKNAQVINNTFVNCDFGLRIGTTVSSDLDQAPFNLVVANNIMYNSIDEDYQINTSPIGNSLSEGNITGLSDTDLIDDGEFHRIPNGSSAIDAGLGNYSFLTKDILGGNRDNNFDIGAEEFGANGTNLPIKSTDVGVSVGFGAISTPSLSVSDPSIDFDIYGGTKTVEIISNVDWTIDENSPWISTDVTSGSGTKTITLTIDENMTGAERSANISVNESAGGDNLKTEITIEQSNTFMPREITIVSTTSMGMQIKEGIEEVNAYDDDVSTYWTGDPDTEAEVSITFDLSCIHKLSEIGINFWKADERTTTFSIAIADVAAGPYTTIIDTKTSAVTGVTVNTEQKFSLEGTTGRYVKFTGIGNSSDSNWTSIANVNIYGDVNCEGTSSIIENQLTSQSLSIYPMPVRDGYITIASTNNDLGIIDLYNMAGQKIMSVNAEQLSSTQIDVTKLQPGIYIAHSSQAGQAKFIVK